MTRDQAQAIIINQMLTGYTFNTESIVAKLAALDPVMLVQLANLDPGQAAWVREAQGGRAAGQAVACIKAIRTGMGCGLWEAKQVWDRMRDGGAMPCAEHLWTADMEKAYQLVKL
jgi:hypothetical protein